MRLKAVMVKLIPDDDIILKTRRFASKDVIFLDLKKYSKILHLGVEKKDKCFITKSHFNIDKDFYYIPAYQLIDLEEGESSRNYLIRYSAKKENVENNLYYDEVYDVFYDVPTVKVKAGKWEYSNKIDEASCGSINAGSFYLNIYDKGKNLKINSKPYKMCVLPSSMSIEKYELMINDLLNIKHELIVEENNGAKQSIQVKWINTLDDIEKVIDMIKKPLSEINRSPKVRLYKQPCKVSLSKVKKFDCKVLMELATNSQKAKYTALMDSEDTNIYENQMILYTLKILKEYINNFDGYLSNKLLSQKQKITLEIKRILEFYNVENLKQLKEIIVKKDKSRFYDLMMSKVNISEDNEGVIEVEIPIFKYSNNIKFQIYFAGGKLHSGIEGVWENGNFSLDYNKKCYTIINKDKNKNVIINGRKALLDLESNDVSQHLLLYYIIFSKQTINLKIRAKVKIKGDNSYDVLRGKQVYNGNGEPYVNIYEYNIKAIEIISINGINTNDFTICEEQLKNIFVNKGFIMNSEQILEQINMLEKKERNIEAEILKNDFKNIQIQTILSKINKLINLKFFNKVTIQKKSWQLTQIYANDKNYSKIYKALRNLDKKLEFTDSFQSKDILNKKADKLYEYWMLIKILHILICEQQWKLKEGISITEYISRFLLGKKDKDLENIEFTLIHDGKESFQSIEMSLYYNKVFSNKKTPDFAFRIMVKDNIKEQVIEKWFYLDAKYRDYSSMGKRWWYNDIDSVAINKYINSFIDTETEATASFIAHTDNREKYVYFGGYFNEELASSLSNWEEDNPQHKFGSFYFLPECTENFITFTKLILEYHFMSEELWKVCWDCGSTDTLVESKSTGGGNEKFHITCKTCNSFWVRNHCESEGHELVKHGINSYHKEESVGDPWYVKCPQCDYTKYIGD